MADKGKLSKRKAWVLVLVSLIDDVIILAVVFGALWYFKVKIPLWGLITIGLVLGAFIFVRTWAVLPSLRRRKVTGAEGMIGMVGRVVESLAPEGVIWVEGEYWHATSVEGHIADGEEVEILELKRLRLEVRRKTDS